MLGRTWDVLQLEEDTALCVSARGKTHAALDQELLFVRIEIARVRLTLIV